VSLFAHQQRQVLQVAHMENKRQSEIPVVRQLIETLHLQGAVLTLDALHCQKKTLEGIVASGNDYLVQVKANQASLHRQAQALARQQSPTDQVETRERGRGRREVRRVRLFRVEPEALAGWPGVRRLVLVERWRTEKGETSHSQSHYLSSLACDRAAVFAAGVRGHWSIENQLHWIKDVLQHEDSCGIARGNGVETLSILKNIALNLVRARGKEDKSVKKAAIYYAANVKRLLQILNF